jgi:hypothetical protein
MHLKFGDFVQQVVSVRGSRERGKPFNISEMLRRNTAKTVKYAVGSGWV